MASILESLKKTATALLDPKRHEESQELEYLRNVYYGKEGNLRPRQWYRLHNEAGNCVGFSYVCSCGQERQLLSAFEWFRDYRCEQCGDRFDLAKFAGMAADTPPSKFEEKMRALPVRPRLAGIRRPPIISTWDDNADTVVWDGVSDKTTFGMANGFGK